MCFAALGDKAKGSSQVELLLCSCIRREAPPDIRIRIPSIVIRISIARAAIRRIIPIAAREKLRH